jgi:hypothetical protein
MDGNFEINRCRRRGNDNIKTDIEDKCYDANGIQLPVVWFLSPYDEFTFRKSRESFLQQSNSFPVVLGGLVV